jgi:hypothetical protein
MMDAMRGDMRLGIDFLSVFDVGQDADPLGKIVTVLPVGAAAMAHYTNYEMPSDGILQANDWTANHSYVFNLRDLLHPVLNRQFTSAGDYSWPHSFVHLTSGNTLVT